MKSTTNRRGDEANLPLYTLERHAGQVRTELNAKRRYLAELEREIKAHPHYPLRALK